jgi:MHS family proline/betaine transporter-like MFS transporter
LGYSLSANLPETDDFVQLKETDTVEAQPLVTLLENPTTRKRLIFMIGATGFAGASYYFAFTWLATYTETLADTMSGSASDTVTFACLLICMVGSACFGYLSDKVGRVKVILCSFGCLTLYLPFCQYIVLYGNGAASVAAQIGAAIMISAHAGVTPSWEVELWADSPSIRYSAVAIGHNVSLAIFGGTITSIATALYALNTTFVWSALYCSVVGVMSYFCVWELRGMWDEHGRSKMKRKNSNNNTAGMSAGDDAETDRLIK